jgi:hypothetical protein
MSDHQHASPLDDQIDDDCGAGGEKRSRERTLVTRDISITPLDDDLKPVKKTFRGQTKDISTTGVSFIHATPCDSKFVVVTIPKINEVDVELLFRVIRTEELDGSRYFTAGTFVTRLQTSI